MTATPEAVAAVMAVLGCEEVDHPERPYCEVEHHPDEPWFRERWDHRGGGCSFAAAAADAAVAAAIPHIAAQALREAAADWPHEGGRLVGTGAVHDALSDRADRIDADRG